MIRNATKEEFINIIMDWTVKEEWNLCSQEA
jgi:hypothetical protein